MTSAAYSSLRHRALDPVVVRRVTLSLPRGKALDDQALGQLPAAHVHLTPRPPGPAAVPHRTRAGELRGPYRGPVHESETATTVELIGSLADVSASLKTLVDRFHARITDEEVLPAAGEPIDLVYPDPGPLRRIAVPWDPLAPVRVPDSALSSNLSTEPIVVAIVDSGVMTTHPALRDRLNAGVTVIGRDAEDEDGHGTLLAGTILSVTNHSPTVRLKPVKFIDGRTRPQSDLAGDAIRKAFEQEPYPHIINLSWDLGVETPKLYDAIAHAASRGVLVVVAAGNNGGDNDKYHTFPACYGHEGCKGLTRKSLPNVLTVMATDRSDFRAGFSNYGATSVHLAAPGVGIVSAHQYLAAVPAPGGGSRYQRYDGTSAAAAYVSGTAAVLLSKNPKLTPKAIKKVLGRTSDYGLDFRCRSRGRLNLGRALERVFDPAWLLGESGEDEMLSEQAEALGIA
jgi:subtilisin family serine protease